jgi:hypothetical protein
MRRNKEKDKKFFISAKNTFGIEMAYLLIKNRYATINWAKWIFL